MHYIPNAEPRSAHRSTPNSIQELRAALLGRVIAPATRTTNQRAWSSTRRSTDGPR